MKKILSLTLVVVIFLASLAYLHQKVQIHVEAYRLSNNYARYNELLDLRDHLLHMFSQELSLSKVNEWAQDQHFTLADKERIVAFSLRKEVPQRPNKFAALLTRMLRFSGSGASAMAGEEH